MAAIAPKNQKKEKSDGRKNLKKTHFCLYKCTQKTKKWRIGMYLEPRKVSAFIVTRSQAFPKEALQRHVSRALIKTSKTAHEGRHSRWNRICSDFRNFTRFASYFVCTLRHRQESHDREDIHPKYTIEATKIKYIAEFGLNRFEYIPAPSTRASRAPLS